MGRPERPIDPEAGPLHRFAFDLRHLREKAGSPSYRQLARQAHYSATALSEAAGAEQLPSLAVTLAYVRACDGDPVEWERRWREVAAEHAEATGERPSPPYLGLAAFQPADADRYFGREVLVAELVERLGRQRLIVLFGPSGSGKSSLLRAGLIPALDGARPVLMSPTASPMAELAARFAPSGEADLLVVDQFEEVFTLCDDADQRRAFVETLVATADSTRVVVSVRADFLGHCAEFPGLVRALRDAYVLVGPMREDELRQAIERPAARHGLKADNDMVAAALADVRGQPGALPLLSHALLETWHRRERNRLTLAGYRASGGVAGAIAATAERAFAELTPSGRPVARSVVLRLVRLDDDARDVRRRAALSDVLGMGRPAETAQVLDRLATARLVVVADGSVELGHEALTREWPRLKRWIAEDRQALRVHRQLTIAAAAWETVGRDPGALYRGVQLAAARDLAERADWNVSSSASERLFVQAGAEAETAAHGVALRQARRMKLLAQSLTALLLVCTVVAAVAVVQRRSAIREREIATSRQLAVEAQDLSASSPGEAGARAVSAYREADTAEARGALFSTAAYKPAREVFREHRARVRAVAFDGDGTLLASAGDDGAVLLRDVRDGARPVQLDRDAGGVRALAFQPGRPLLASAGEDPQVVLWDVRTRVVSRVLPVPHGQVNTVAFSADGALLAAGSQDGTVTLWDTARWHQIAGPPRRVGAVYDVAFSAAANLLAVAGATGVLLADRMRGVNRLLRDHDGPVLTVALSRDGHTLASGGDDQQVVLRDLTRDAAPTFLRRHVSPVNDVEFTHDGTRLLSAGGDGSIRWWAAPGGGYLTAVASRVEPFFAAALSPDGERLAAGGDESVSLWSRATPSFTGHTRPPDALAFNADGTLLATAGSDSTIMVWNRDGRPQTVIGTRTPVTALAFRPDGTLVAGDLGGNVTVWNVATGTEIRTLAAHRDAVAGIAVDPQGRLVVSGGRDHTVVLADLAAGTAARVLPVGHRGPVNAVAFDATGELIASAGADGRVALWDVGHDRPFAPLVDGGTAVKAVAFSPRGPLLATGDAAGNIVLWNSADHTRTGTLHTHGATRSLAISADGRSLAAAGSDSVVNVWEVDGGRPVAALAGHTGPANAVAFAPGGRPVLASSGPDPRVVLWDLDPAAVIAELGAVRQ